MGKCSWKFLNWQMGTKAPGSEAAAGRAQVQGWSRDSPTPPKGSSGTTECMRTSLAVMPPLEVSDITRLISYPQRERVQNKSGWGTTPCTRAGRVQGDASIPLCEGHRLCLVPWESLHHLSTGSARLEQPQNKKAPCQTRVLLSPPTHTAWGCCSRTKP